MKNMAMENASKCIHRLPPASVVQDPGRSDRRATTSSTADRIGSTAASTVGMVVGLIERLMAVDFPLLSLENG